MSIGFLVIQKGMLGNCDHAFLRMSTMQPGFYQSGAQMWIFTRQVLKVATVASDSVYID